MADEEWSMGSNPLANMQLPQRAPAGGADASATSGVPPAQLKKRYTLEDFEFGDELGEGAYGRVVYAKLKETGEEFAVKVLEKKQIIKQNKTRQVSTERDVLNMMHHPNIIRLLCTFQDEEYLYFVLEYAPKGELFTYIHRLGPRPEDVVRYYTAEVVNALEYMHGRGILHRDLKPENILLSRDMHVKLTDFGTAKIMERDDAAPGESGVNFVGTAEYVSPEVLSQNTSSPSSDLWALGCIVYQMLFGKPPFRGESEYLTFQKIISVEYEVPEEPRISPAARDLIEQLLHRDPEQRIGAREGGYAELKAHPFFAGVRFASLYLDELPPLVQPGESMTDEPAEMDSSDSVWDQFLNDGERIVHIGPVVKRRKWTAKKRNLMLTDTPRLVYVDPKRMVKKGEIPFSPDLWVEWRNDRDFIVHTPKRNYILEDVNNAAKRWVDTITQLKISLGLSSPSAPGTSAAN